MANYRRNLRKVMLLIIPTWLAIAAEAVGGWRFNMDTYSGRYAISLGGLRDPLILLTLGAVIVSPALVVIGLFVMPQNHTQCGGTKRLFSAVRLLLTISLVVSMFSCVWSCGGHPTWSSGFR
jgi:hypothetical protein